MRRYWSSAVLAAALSAAPALGQGLKAVPDSAWAELQPSSSAFDTILLVNPTQAALRVDSITIRLLDGGPNPKASDFTACKACAPDSLGAYVYGGWLYGTSQNQSLRYLRDSLFLIQDNHGVPVSLNVAGGASAPFALYFPVNCPFCGRLPAYPGATHYAFTFIAADGSRAGLAVAVGHPSALIFRESRPARNDPGQTRDAAGRIESRPRGLILYR
jgi:hypothetical protein